MHTGLAWDDLRYVLAVAREGTLSRAAERLGVNHSTVSRRLSALSDQLGVRLFERMPDGYVPTPAGEDVVRVAARLEDDVLSLEGRVLGRDAELRGPLLVTTTDLLARLLIPDLKEFCQRYPKIDLEISVDYGVANLGKREADVAVRLTNQPPEHLVGRKVGRMEFALYGAAPLLAKHGRKAPLGSMPWLAWSERVGAKLTEEWMRQHVPQARIVLRVDHAVPLFDAMRAGLGIAFLPCIHGDRDPALQRLRPVQEGFGMDIWILSHMDLKASARVRAFTHFAAEVFANESHGFLGILPT